MEVRYPRKPLVQRRSNFKVTEVYNIDVVIPFYDMGFKEETFSGFIRPIAVFTNFRML